MKTGLVIVAVPVVIGVTVFVIMNVFVAVVMGVIMLLIGAVLKPVCMLVIVAVFVIVRMAVTVVVLAGNPAGSASGMPRVLVLVVLESAMAPVNWIRLPPRM